MPYWCRSCSYFSIGLYSLFPLEFTYSFFVCSLLCHTQNMRHVLLFKERMQTVPFSLSGDNIKWLTSADPFWSWSGWWQINTTAMNPANFNHHHAQQKPLKFIEPKRIWSMTHPIVLKSIANIFISLYLYIHVHTIPWLPITISDKENLT